MPEAVRKVGRAPDPADGRATAGRFNSGHVHQGKRPYYGQAGAGNPASGSSLSDWLMERHLAARKDGQLNDALVRTANLDNLTLGKERMYAIMHKKGGVYYG